MPKKSSEILKTKEASELEKLSEEEQSELGGYQFLIKDCNNSIEMYKKAIEKAKNVMNEISLHIGDFPESLKLARARFDQGTPENKRVIVETLCANIKWDCKNVVWD